MAGLPGDPSVDKATRPTNADVARMAQVSTATVSYVLNNTAGRRISPRTREVVNRAAEQLGYRPSATARNLARGEGGVVLYVVPRVAVGDTPIQAGSRMATELARFGLLQVQIFETEDDQDVIDAVTNLDPIAVISLFPLSNSARRAVDAAAVPHIEIGVLPALGDPMLAVGTLRVEHLVSRGHRKIAFAYGGVAKWRALGDYWLDGISRAASAHNLPGISVGDTAVPNAADMVTTWVHDEVTAVCAQSDEVAALVLYGIREAGLRCPSDLAVAGVGGNPMGAFSTPPLTTVEFNPTAVAEVARDAVLTKLGYPAQSPAEPPADLASLVVRAST